MLGPNPEANRPFRIRHLYESRNPMVTKLKDTVVASCSLQKGNMLSRDEMRIKYLFEVCYGEMQHGNKAPEERSKSMEIEEATSDVYLDNMSL